jgi:hypothetical protein
MFQFEGSKRFFFEKKKQKTFPRWCVPRAKVWAPTAKSFLVLFFKKEQLSV